MPMATSWSYVPDDPYKSARTLVHMLVDVVAKGGNLLLNIGPGPDGRWHDDAYDRLAALGAWMRVNGEAIYGTRAVAPYGADKVRLTRGGDGTVFALYLADEGEDGCPGPSRFPVCARRPGRWSGSSAPTRRSPGSPRRTGCGCTSLPVSSRRRPTHGRSASPGSAR